MDVPVSENALTGIGIGSVTHQMPVHSVMAEVIAIAWSTWLLINPINNMPPARGPKMRNKRSFLAMVSHGSVEKSL